MQPKAICQIVAGGKSFSAHLICFLLFGLVAAWGGESFLLTKKEKKEKLAALIMIYHFRLYITTNKTLLLKHLFSSNILVKHLKKIFFLILRIASYNILNGCQWRKLLYVRVMI